jgi:hypothetical protein
MKDTRDENIPYWLQTGMPSPANTELPGQGFMFPWDYPWPHQSPLARWAASQPPNPSAPTLASPSSRPGSLDPSNPYWPQTAMPFGSNGGIFGSPAQPVVEPWITAAPQPNRLDTLAPPVVDAANYWGAVPPALPASFQPQGLAPFSRLPAPPDASSWNSNPALPTENPWLQPPTAETNPIWRPRASAPETRPVAIIQEPVPVEDAENSIFGLYNKRTVPGERYTSAVTRGAHKWNADGSVTVSALGPDDPGVVLSVSTDRQHATRTMVTGSDTITIERDGSISRHRA